MTEPSTEPTVEPTEAPAPEPAAEPAPEPAPAETTLTITETTPDVEEEMPPPIPFAPGYLFTSPHAGAPHLNVSWGQPNEGPADRFVLTVNGSEYEVPGTAQNVTLENLPPETPFSVRITAFVGEESGSLEIPATQVQAFNTEPQPQDFPADADGPDVSGTTTETPTEA